MGKKPRRPNLLDASAAAGELRRLMGDFLRWQQVHNFSPATVKVRESDLLLFALWCEERSVSTPAEVTRPMLERYQRHLFLSRKSDGKPLSFTSQRRRLVTLKVFFRWLVRSDCLLSNPASELELPRSSQRLPHILSSEELARILDSCDVSTPSGLRDRAMLEVLWATGIRRMELAGLTLASLDAERGTLMVRQGKGKKDRLVPIAERAVRWVEKYLAEARPALLVPPDSGALFLATTGEAFTVEHLSVLIRRRLDDAGVEKPGACHLFRHSMATAMLEGGADVRFIQQLLGHADLSSTALYTQVSIRALLEVYARTHPAAKGADGRREQLAAEPPPATPEALLASLAEEAAAEDAGDDEDE